MNQISPQSQSSGASDQPSDRKRKFNFWRAFWLTFLFASLAYAWYCFYVPSNDICWAESYDSAERQAADSGKPIILHFTGKWCVPCKVMKRQVWADDEVATLVNAGFIPVLIDVDDHRTASLLTRYKVSGAPVTIVTDPQGKALRWRAGGMSKSAFLELLELSTSLDLKDK